MLSKLTLIGLNSFTDGDIFADLTFPEGIEKELVVNEILKAGGEFCVLYSDPDFLKEQITMWGKKWYHNFERWIKAYNFEYEALYNLDVKATITESGVNHESSSSNGYSGGTSGNTHSKAAYDANSFQNTERDDGTTSVNSSSNSNGSSDHNVTTEEYRRGNQGLTMSQEMLLSEYNAWRFNLYSQMADIFVSEFCVTLYS